MLDVVEIAMNSFVYARIGPPVGWAVMRDRRLALGIRWGGTRLVPV